MPDILASAKTPTPPLLPIRADVDLPFSSHATSLPQEPEPEPAIPPPVGNKKRGSKSLILAVLLFLLATLPLTVYFTSQQRQLADLRGRAQVGPYPCGPAGKSCNDVGDCGTSCSSQNWVCVGIAGQKTCQQHGPDLCPGGSCTKVNAYRCDALDSGGQCHQNLRTDVGDFAAGRSYAAGCGQVDDVCRGGSRDNLGCGNFEIINTTCGTTTTTPPPGTGPPPPPPPPGNTPTPTSPPPPTATPTPTPPPGGTCELIKLYDATGTTEITQAVRDGTKKLAIGEQVTIATSKGNATKARFRIQGIADWAENDPAKTTATEYRLSINIPSTLTQSQGTFEVEVFVSGVWK